LFDSRFKLLPSMSLLIATVRRWLVYWLVY
jgi:hypothetical protein